MEQVDFGPFRATPETVWRPPRPPPFAPRYRLEAAVFDDLRAVERADQELRRFRVDEATARRILEDALTKNAYGTASIEGNPLTVEDVESLLARAPEPSVVERPEEREILNYVAFARRLDAWPVPRATDEVLALHRALFDGVLPDAGRLKDRPNFVGRRPERVVVFVPTMPERVREELDSALAWLAEAPEHPLAKALVVFHEFQGIHPFRDGNGRAGRALLTLLLHRAGYENVRYALVDYQFNADRGGYYGHLAEVERNGWDYTPWVAYAARVLRDGFEDAVRRFLFRDGLPADLHERQVRVAEWLARLDRARPGQEVKFNDAHAAFPAVPPRTLKRDLATLRDAGVLVMEGERKGARYRLAR